MLTPTRISQWKSAAHQGFWVHTMESSCSLPLPLHSLRAHTVLLHRGFPELGRASSGDATHPISAPSLHALSLAFFCTPVEREVPDRTFPSLWVCFHRIPRTRNYSTWDRNQPLFHWPFTRHWVQCYCLCSDPKPWGTAHLSERAHG